MMSRMTYLLLETLISALPMALGRPVKLMTKLMTLEPAIRNMMTAVVSQRPAGSWQILDLDAAVNNDGQEQGVGNSHGSGLRCSKDAGHNAADDDDDQQQAGDGVHEVLEENGSRNLTSSGIVVLLCDDIRHHHAGQCHIRPGM